VLFYVLHHIKIIIVIYLYVQMHIFITLQVQKYWFPENEMKKRYPQIQGFFAVSSFSGEVSTLQFHLCDSAFYSR